MSKSYSGLIPDGRLLLAFSGGEDSLFLLSLLSEHARERSAALYVNHALRPPAELEREEELNKANCLKLGIPFILARLAPGEVEKAGEGVEDGARRLRYKVLFSYAREHGFDHILTAHHQDDQAETVLMRMLSGSPFYAWTGIRREEGLLCRPLLSVSKAEIKEEVRRRGLAFSSDSTNTDTSYLRNQVRKELLPALSAGEKELLSRIAENVGQIRRRYPPLDGGAGFFKRYDRRAVLEANPIALEETVYSLSLTGERITRSFIGELSKGAVRGSGKLEGFGLSFRFTSSEVLAYPVIDDFVLEVTDEDIVFQGLRLSHKVEDSRTLCFDASLFKPPVILRTSRPGDYVRLKGGWKRVQDMNKDWKIPYSLVLEDRKGIACVFARFLGGSDRLSVRFLGVPDAPAALAICPARCYISRQ